MICRRRKYSFLVSFNSVKTGFGNVAVNSKKPLFNSEGIKQVKEELKKRHGAENIIILNVIPIIGKGI